MNKHTKYLIIGNSAAGIGCVEGIRKVDPLGQILLISDEPYHTYSRPLISYYLEGKVDKDHMKYRSDDYYDKEGVITMLGNKVEELDLKDKIVRLDDGEILSFDKLLLATGSHPFIPPINGKDTAKDATPFTKMEDMEKIEELLKDTPNPKVVILGAGLIGLKAAEAVYDSAESITVLDLADRVMPSVFNEGASDVMKKHIQEKGIDLRLGTSIDEILDHQVKLTDGDILDYDLLVLAVGTRPAEELASDVGIECNRGIIVNSHQETSAKDVYAAGDCTNSHDISSGLDKNMALLPNAYMQGETAGINMAGGEAECNQLFPVNSMGFLGLYLLTAGSYQGESVIEESPECFKEFFIEDNKLKGFIIIGTCDRAGIYTDLIRQGTDLSSLNLKRLLKTPGLSNFSKEKRAEKLSMPH